jgi:GTP-binding protein EngB required for normal cell division
MNQLSSSSSSSTNKRKSITLIKHGKFNSSDELFDKLKKDKIKYIIFVGNPGVGKSTLLNCLAGEVLFESGVSADGMTNILQIKKCREIYLIDTPGLDDISRKKQAAKEIEKALKQGGLSKLIFVVTLESGRVRPSDIATMNLVLESIEEKEREDVKYGIIINKVTKAVFEANIFDSITRYFATLVKPEFYCVNFIKNLYELDGNNVLADPPKQMLETIYKTPSILIQEYVNKISTEAYEDLKKKYEKELEIQKEELEKLKKQLIEISKQLNKSKIKRFKTESGRKVHSEKCHFIRNSDDEIIEVLNYTPGDQCLHCVNYR